MGGVQNCPTLDTQNQHYYSSNIYKALRYL